MTTKLITLPVFDEIIQPDWTDILPDPKDQTTASDYWHSTVAEMQTAGTLSPINAIQIKRYCVVLVMYDRETALLIAEGPILLNKKTKVPRYNPRWSISRDLDNLASSHEDRLGLSPRRRGQVTAAPKTKKKSAADSFLSTVR